jgi:chromate transporter
MKPMYSEMHKERRVIIRAFSAFRFLQQMKEKSRLRRESEMSGKPAIDLKFYLKLFWTTFTLSLFTFGGGFVIVSLMRKKMVDQYGWINDEEMMDFITIAQSSPGPIAVNASLMVGYHLAGIPGALISTLGTILPPMIILTFISIGYQAVAENTWIKAAFHGMRAVVAAIVLQVTWALFKSLAEKKNILPLVLFAAAFVALFVFKVNIMVVMVAMILLSVVLSIHETKKENMS